jgi:hypothetical protein
MIKNDFVVKGKVCSGMKSFQILRLPLTLKGAQDLIFFPPLPVRSGGLQGLGHGRKSNDVF